MNDLRYIYAFDKLNEFIKILAVEKGDLRSRIRTIGGEFAVLDESHFPEELRKNWNTIMKELTKSGPDLNFKGEVRIGDIENTTYHRKNSTYSKIVEEIFELRDKLKKF